MIGALVERRIRAAERDLGAPMDWARDVWAASRGLFLDMMRFTRLSGRHRALPAIPFHAARIVAVRHEDCGTCVQIAVSVARSEGVDRALVAAMLRDEEAALPEDAVLAMRFARAVCTRDGEAGDALRPLVVARWGKAGLVELSLAVATVRVFPVLKRGLGHARSCALVHVEP
jgi:alkylhydroperoxidase family enzyme